MNTFVKIKCFKLTFYLFLKMYYGEKINLIFSLSIY